MKRNGSAYIRDLLSYQSLEGMIDIQNINRKYNGATGHVTGDLIMTAHPYVVCLTLGYGPAQYTRNRCILR